MEFPELGKHCSDKTCKQLDFLPMKCDACEEIFCKDHLYYDKHNCSSSYKKNIQVPVCPLCNIPIPVKRGELPDYKVSAHIDTDCQSDPAKGKRKVFSRCSAHKCKTKEIVKINCSDCGKVFCLVHRHPSDHDCQNAKSTKPEMVLPKEKAGEAALARFANFMSSKSSKTSTPTAVSLATINNGSTNRNRTVPPKIQGQFSEDEALARAIQESMQHEQPSQNQASGFSHNINRPNQGLSPQEEEDEMLARAIAESEREARRENFRQQSLKAGDGTEKNCIIS